MAQPKYEALEIIDQPSIGLFAAVALHSTAAGPAFGGIRRQRYGSTDAAVADALRLAEAMSIKCALASLPAGGGKTVVAVPTDDAADWPAVYRAVGRAVASLGGRYVCGPDVGTGPQQLAWVRTQTQHVNPEGNDAGSSTAAGVLAGLRAIWQALGRGPRGSRVAVQGLGSVGAAVAQGLLAQGAEVVGADPDPLACARATKVGVRIVDPAEIVAVECDVLMPCAMGQVFDLASIAQLRCRAVCGSANNQLCDVESAHALHQRGILHAPDEVVSAGAVIEGVLTVTHGRSVDVLGRVQTRIEGIAFVLADVLGRAAAEDRPPSVVARERGERRIERLTATASR